MPSGNAALVYTEPGIVTILIYASFLLLLNVVNSVLDRTVYCGMIGQVFIGIAWGVPGASWIPLEAQDTIMQLGYLGLILIVQGGLSTNIKSVKANLFLSATVASIGISVPMALSFTLRGLLDITPLQAFAAGAALCSTSLGTTFTVLATSGLSDSRLGVVLTSAAMMDDVVGLVMVQVIPNLGDSSFDWVTVVRPIGVSFAFAIILPLICLWVVKPLTILYYTVSASAKAQSMRSIFTSTAATFVCHTAVLLALVTGSSYAGTSSLFAAYLAGAGISWWDVIKLDLYNEQQHRAVSPQHPQCQARQKTPLTGAARPEPTQDKQDVPPPTGVAIHERYYGPAVQVILKPLFFASIGFSIPITRMFEGGIVWRGFVYTILMAVGKLLCGVCLVRFASSDIGKVPRALRICWPSRRSNEVETQSRQKPKQAVLFATPAEENAAPDVSDISTETTEHAARGTHSTKQANASPKRSSLPKPRSLYPAAILGSAMMARGEIGFLISSVAESKGVYDKETGQGSSQLFLVVTWAILLCTILGPVTVGLLVKRVKRLQALERRDSAGKDDPLGVWGVLSTA
ncbi:hypothetical protein LTR65_005567 [Meristemomyces frigidus]